LCNQAERIFQDENNKAINKQTNQTRVGSNKGGSQVLGEQLHLDTSSIEDSIYEGSKFWDSLVDNFTDFSYVIFLKNKNHLKNRMFTLLNDIKIAGIDVKIIRYDDYGYNISFYDSC
jgi:hypothetical protein